MSSAPAIQLSNICYAVGEEVILDEINLDIGTGEFMGVIGPNGAGKTTLFRIILGFVRPTKGSVSIFGEPIHQMRHTIGYVPQFANFRRDFPITVADTVLSGRLSGQSIMSWLWRYTAEDKAAAHNIMQALHIHHLAHRPIARLSGGELQRVLLARALVSRPRILLLDEPTASIDNHREEAIFEILETLNPAPTILIISHDLGFISPRIGRVACLHKTLSIHTPEHLNAQTITALYGHPVHAVHHHHG